MPTRAPARPFLIEHARPVRGLRSPVRQEIVDAVQAEGPRTVARLGERLGRAPDALYYHVWALVRLGLLVEGREANGARPATTLDVPARPMRIRYRPRDAAQVSALQDLASAMLRLTTRDFRAGISSPGACAEGDARNIWAARARANLSPAQLRRLNALLAEATQIMASGSRGAGRADTHPVALTFVLTPVQPRTRRARLGDPP